MNAASPTFPPGALPSPAPPASMKEYVDRHQAGVFRICMGVLRRRDLAEDATQETFLAVLRQGGVPIVHERGRAWLHRVAVNAALQSLRAERRRRLRDRAAGMARIAAADARPGEHDLAAPDRLIVRREIEALPARWRLPILLRLEEGLTYREIAAALDLPEGTVASRLHEGLALLRHALTIAGLVMPAAELQSTVALLPPYQIPTGLAASLQKLVEEHSATAAALLSAAVESIAGLWGVVEAREPRAR